MANVPTYDPSNYQDVTNYSDFQNNTVDYAYEPGSDFKLLTMTAAVNQGAVTPNTTFNNTGTVTVDGDTIENVESHPGSTTMQVVIDLSLNTGAVFMLQQLGGGQIDQQGKTLLYNYFTQKYGFGQKTGIEQTGEDAGTIYSPTNVQGDDIRYANMTFGQGIDATMIQVASAFDAIVNGGTYYKPQLLAGTVNDQGQVISTTKPDVERAGIITPQTASTIKQVAVTALDATPTLTAINTPGYFTGGKTGTSQVIDPATGAYTNVDPIGTYLGFGGGSGSNATPKYVIMIRVDNSHIPGYSGSTAAAPIFANISNWLINYYGLQPTS
jgi:cell division protein FtsI/penicillin-binding protein 2